MKTRKIIQLLLSCVVLKFLLQNKLGVVVVVLRTYWAPSLSLNRNLDYSVWGFLWVSSICPS